MLQAGTTPSQYFKTSGASRTASLPLALAGDPFAFLVEETDISLDQMQRARWTKVYARIPRNQVVQTTRAISKPSPATLATSTLTSFTKDGVNQGAAYVYGPAIFSGTSVYCGAACTVSRPVATGGTFTITYGASTTAALAYNAVSTDIATALNGLASSIAEGITWFVGVGDALTGTQVRLYLLPSIATLYIPKLNLASISGANTKSYAYPTGINFYIGSSALVTFPAPHGFTVGKYIALNVSTAGYAFVNDETSNAIADSWSTNDSTKIWLNWNYALGISFNFCGQYARSYTAGPAIAQIRKTSRFYLPGVTYGVSTSDDIPVPANAANDAALLTLVATNTTGFAAYDSDALASWHGPIYVQANNEINLSSL
jgi:hypothetical protein